MEEYTKLLAGLGLAMGGFVFLGFIGYPLGLIVQSLALIGVGVGLTYYLTRRKT